VSFIELHVVFLLVGLLLLIVEVLLGMALGIALSGAITFFILGLLAWLNIFQGLNNYLIVGSVTFVVVTFFVLRYFKNKVRHARGGQDVNDY
jgi:membrane protein implicated in regulation of membrane protease activity